MMSNLIRQRPLATQAPAIGPLDTQTSAYGMAIPIVWGTTRIPGNLVWYGDFNTVSNSQKSSGKGGALSQSTTSYTYTCALAVGLCEGPIIGIGQIWKDKTNLLPVTSGSNNITVHGEPQLIPTSGPWVCFVEEAAYWVSNVSVVDQYGAALTNVSPSAPGHYQYSVSAGEYTFYSGDAGTQVYISYVFAQPIVTTSPLAQLNMSLFLGTNPQTAWGYLTTNHPTEALGYQSLAYVASGLYQMGSSTILSNHSFEIQGRLQFSDTILDANPYQVVVDFLTNSQYGVGYPSNKLGDFTQFSNYCVSTGLFISPGLTEQQDAVQVLQDILDAVNCTAFYSEGVLKIVPYGDQTVTANGVTFVPNITPIYSLTDDDYITARGDDPVTVTRKRQADAFNQVQIEFLNRSNQYNTQVATAQDEGDIDLNGLRPANTTSYHMICDPNIAQLSAQLMLQRVLNIRNTYKFSLSWQYCLIEPMDILTLTDSNLGLVNFPVRVQSVSENEEGELAIEAEEFPIGIGASATYNSQAPNGYTSGYNLQPSDVNAPLIFEPPLGLTSGTDQIWIAASGGVNWGGCEIWLSLDGQTYSFIGELTGASRYGQLVSAMGALSGSNPDTTNNATVLLNSNGQLLSGTVQDAASYVTLCYVGGEVFSYATSTLQAVNQYELTYLYRGLYGTPSGSHAMGATFARLDQSVFKYQIPSNFIGKTIYLKFTSFNAYGIQTQPLSDVSAYVYTVTGGLPPGPSGLALQSAFVGTSFTVQWSPVAGALSYTVEIIASGVTRRTITVTTTSYTYTVADAVADGGPWRSYSIDVQTVTSTQTSAPSQITAAIAEPVAVTGLATSSPSSGQLNISWGASTAPALSGYNVYMSATNGFTPSSGNLVDTTTLTSATLTGLTSGTTYYLVVAAFDVWGPGSLNYSAQISQVVT